MQLSKLATILNAELQGNDSDFTSVSINTRDLMPGQLFVALKGQQFDGHDFLSIACERKAAAAVIAKNQQLVTPITIPTLKVVDPKQALGQMAAYHRSQYQLPIIAVTGSCGKTTTQAMIAAILNQLAPTLSPLHSFNNDIGVPLTLLNLQDKHRYAVIEMGANHLNEINYLSRITQQNIAVITNVAPAHLAGFGTLEGIAQAKGEIYNNLTPQGTAIINVDDQFASYWQENLATQSVLTFGIKNPATIRASNIKLNTDTQAQFDVTYPEGVFSVKLPLLGEHNVMNALAAIAAAYSVGAPTELIVSGLEQVLPVSKRLNKYSGTAGCVVIDDCYNANPLSVTAALKTLSHNKGEKIFVIGAMAELGDQEQQFHQEVGETARVLGIDTLFGYGPLTQFTVKAFGKNGFYFEDQCSLIAALKARLHSRVIVLIKGSRSARMERVVQALIQET